MHRGRLYRFWTAYTFVNVFHYQPGDIYSARLISAGLPVIMILFTGHLCRCDHADRLSGIPHGPTAGRFWDIRASLQRTSFIRQPTAIRSLMGFGLRSLYGKRPDSLKVLSNSLNPSEEAWHWYAMNIGKGMPDR